MSWIGVLIVSPIWGTISTRLFLQSWLALLQGIIGIIGLFDGRVERKVNGVLVGFSFGAMVVCSLLWSVGFWLLYDVLGFGYSAGETTVYWVFVAVSALYFLPQIPGRLGKTWRNAMVPGSLEDDIAARKLGEESQDKDMLSRF